ncbi:neutral zinc metallopeptidase [Naumannella halotolerans]|uniref:Metalloprotease n=1 Tax=Naumannella halotolerans TaxID=993414 RepID=A0A4R7IZ18_9ACTN|nr:neutral zinc metallopeptidase [Naumannella halotolerans]TDT30042.1 hypothetical protein CLV29_3065 [Naumannella halotolerans]
MSQQQPYRSFGTPGGSFGAPQQFQTRAYPQRAPQFGGQPQPGPPAPQFGGQPPRRRSSPGAILLTAIGCLALIVGAVFITNSLFNSDDNVAYANENYTPPPVDENPDQFPIPETYDELSTMLYSNPINAEQVSAPIRCETSPVDPATASPDEVEAHFNDFTGCLMTTWIEPMTSAGWTLPRPAVTVYEGTIDTPCGDLPEMNAVYCSANQQLYFSMELADLPGTSGNPAVFDMVMAHEFGHDIQGRTGQMAAAVILSEELSEAEALKMSRMREAQADCYAGLFLNSAASSVPYTEADAQEVLEYTVALGADTQTGDADIESTHPHGATREYWTQMGMSTTEIGRCNTYVVSDDSLTD